LVATDLLTEIGGGIQASAKGYLSRIDCANAEKGLCPLVLMPEVRQTYDLLLPDCWVVDFKRNRTVVIADEPPRTTQDLDTTAETLYPMRLLGRFEHLG